MANLRQRQTEETRTLILDTAMTLLAEKAPFSHETIAGAANIGPRTVYRHFPSRTELYVALWHRLRTATNMRFPEKAGDILPMLANVFRSFDENTELINATIASEAGHHVRNQGVIDARASLRKSLSPFLQAMPETDRNRLIAVCLAIFSAPFWQLLRERGELSQIQAEEAAVWAMKTVLGAAGVEWPDEPAGSSNGDEG